jgi:hypothetical protein
MLQNVCGYEGVLQMVPCSKWRVSRAAKAMGRLTCQLTKTSGWQHIHCDPISGTSSKKCQHWKNEKSQKMERRENGERVLNGPVSEGSQKVGWSDDDHHCIWWLDYAQNSLNLALNSCASTGAGSAVHWRQWTSFQAAHNLSCRECPLAVPPTMRLRKSRSEHWMHQQRDGFHCRP